MRQSLVSSSLLVAAREAVDWLDRKALPLWAGTGFNRAIGAFEERLDFSMKPVPDVPLRVMVQARQVAVFSHAALCGRHREASSIALLAAENMIKRYEEADSKSGWVFSIAPDGRLIDTQRDLYAHAFVLFSLAWALRVERRESFYRAIERTIHFLDKEMADVVAGGFWDALPRTDKLRRQNPHMHLFEAWVALYEATGDKQFLHRATQLRDLAAERFMAGNGSGALREVFHTDWSVAPCEGEGCVEPGHLFEWSWLLWRYALASKTSQDDLIIRLMRMANDTGLDRATGKVVDEVGEDGRIRKYSSRSWPHAEALKALTCLPKNLGGGDQNAIEAILRRLMTHYCADGLGGGWQDHVDEHERPLRQDIPASTLYHIYFGIISVQEFLSGAKVDAAIDRRGNVT